MPSSPNCPRKRKKAAARAAARICINREATRGCSKTKPGSRKGAGRFCFLGCWDWLIREQVASSLAPGKRQHQISAVRGRRRLTNDGELVDAHAGGGHVSLDRAAALLRQQHLVENDLALGIEDLLGFLDG